MLKDFPEPSQASLTDIAGAYPDILAEYLTSKDLGGLAHHAGLVGR